VHDQEPTQIGSNQKLFFTSIEEVHHDGKGLSRPPARNKKKIKINKNVAVSRFAEKKTD